MITPSYMKPDGTGINRNIVECKSSVKNDMGYKICGINRNIVECK